MGRGYFKPTSLVSEMAETAEPMGVKARKALYEQRARQPSAEKLEKRPSPTISGTEAGGVRSAAKAYQSKLTVKEQNQNVLRGKKDAPVAAAAPNYVVASRSAQSKSWLCWCCGAGGERAR